MFYDYSKEVVEILTENELEVDGEYVNCWELWKLHVAKDPSRYEWHEIVKSNNSRSGVITLLQYWIEINKEIGELIK